MIEPPRESPQIPEDTSPSGTVGAPLRPPRRVFWIPLRAKRPWVAQLLVGANVLAFLLGLLAGRGGLEGVAWRFGQYRELVWLGEHWRILTGMFIHAGVGHLALNMLALLMVGRILERVLGHARFGIVYLISGVTGALAFQVFSSGTVGLGASGAVYGTFGALLVLRSAVRGGGGWRSIASFVRWSAFVLLFDFGFAVLMEMGSAVQVASSAHIGGFVGGAASGFLLLAPVVVVAPRWSRLRVPTGVAFAVLVVGFAVYAFTVEPETPDRPGGSAAQVFRFLEAGSPDRAVDLWRSSQSRGGRSWPAVGYELFGHLTEQGRKELADEVLDELIAEGWKTLRVQAPSATQLAEALNDTAWFLALRGRDLEHAKMLASRAVELTESSIPQGAWRWILPHEAVKERLGTYLNTLGWVEFRRGEHKEGLHDLKRAAELFPTGANFLFLAWAYYALGEVRLAKEALERVRLRGGGGLATYEEVLLRELEGNLRGT